MDIGFTAKYNVDKLVYFEEVENAITATKREKQIKGLLREKKIKLIELMTPDWDDLSKQWIYKILGKIDF